MSDNENNGKKELIDTVKQEAKNHTKELKSGDIKNAFTIPGNHNIADKLVEPGDDPLGIAMRSMLGKQTEGAILGVAFAAEWGDLEEFEYEDGKKALLFNLAARTSDNGRSRDDLVNAIIGDKQMKARTGFFDKFKPFANKDEPK
jgi:hypothetical protein